MKPIQKIPSFITTAELATCLGCQKENLFNRVDGSLMWFKRWGVAIDGILVKGVRYWSINDLDNLLTAKANYEKKRQERQQMILDRQEQSRIKRENKLMAEKLKEKQAEFKTPRQEKTFVAKLAATYSKALDEEDEPAIATCEDLIKDYKNNKSDSTIYNQQLKTI